MERDEMIHVLLDTFDGREVELVLNLIKRISTEDLEDFIIKDLDLGEENGI